MSYKTKHDSDFQDFVYIVTHDMAASVRQIKSLAHLLAQKSTTPLNEDQQQYMNLIDEIAKTHHLKIEILTEYSELCATEVIDRNATLEDTLSEALLSLRTTISDSNASITSHPLPELRVNKEMFERAFREILDNAIKFTQEGSHPQISVSSLQENGFTKILIEDSGIGIVDQKIDHAFMLFRSIAKNDGLGTGLAFVKKIIELHDGRVSLVNKAGKSGLKVIIELPA